MKARIVGVGTALPPHRYSQGQLLDGLRRIWTEQHYNDDWLGRLHESVQVGGRCLALPMEDYEALRGLGAANDAFVRVATELAEVSLVRGLEAACLAPRDIDAIFFTTVTGVAAPSIDARLVNRLALRSDVKRIPMFGLGCVGGAAGLARAADYLRGHPEDVAVLVSAELCSLTLQREDLSIPNLIATGLFGDGAASAVLVGAERARRPARPVPRVLATASVFYPDTEWIMGWEVGDSGFKVVLSSALADLVKSRVATDLDGFLRAHGLQAKDVGHWICHPGGPKILAALEDALSLPPTALRHSRELLADVGNLSSASVLFVLDRAMPEAREGDTGLLMAMGPGFCAELLLLRWS